MVVITQKAKQHIQEMLAAKTSNPDVGMRLVMKTETGKFALRYDKERESDQVVRYNDTKVLLIDKAVFDRAGFLTIDFGGLGAFPRLFIVAR